MKFTFHVVAALVVKVLCLIAGAVFTMLGMPEAAEWCAVLAAGFLIYAAALCIFHRRK